MPARPEHALQAAVVRWVREHVAQPHLLLAFDRSKASSAMTHMFERGRGILAGTPDTLLLVPDFPGIFVELKAAGKKVIAGSAQESMGNRIADSGHLWFRASSVTQYAGILDHLGVCLVGPWGIQAQAKDAALLNKAIAGEESKTGKPSRKRYMARPTSAQLERVRRIRASGVRV